MDISSEQFWVDIQLSATEGFYDPAEACLPLNLSIKVFLPPLQETFLPLLIEGLDLYGLGLGKGYEVRVFGANQLMNEALFEVAKLRESGLHTGRVGRNDIENIRERLPVISGRNYQRIGPGNNTIASS